MSQMLDTRTEIKNEFVNYLKNRPADGIIKRFYDVGSPIYQQIWGDHFHDGYYITGKETKGEAQVNLTRLLAEKGRIKPGERVLDVGCGIGGSSIWLAQNLKALTTGITISPVQIEIATGLAKERSVSSSFLLMDAEDMHFQETFDVIWVVAAMTHFKDQENFLNTATGLLNRGGRLVIFDWMVGESTAQIPEDKDVFSIGEGMLLSSLFSLSAYLDWLLKHGFQILYTEDVTPYAIRTWNDAFSLVKKPAILKLAYRIAREEGTEVFSFLKAIGTMRAGMRKGKIKAGAVVAQRL